MQILTPTYTRMTTPTWGWTTLSCWLIRNTQNSKPFPEYSWASTCRKLGIIVLTRFTTITWIAFTFANFVLVFSDWRRSWRGTASRVLCTTLLGMRFTGTSKWRWRYSRWTGWRTRFTAKTWHLSPNFSWITRIFTTTWAFSYSIYYAKFKMVNIILQAIFQK